MSETVLPTYPTFNRTPLEFSTSFYHNDTRSVTNNIDLDQRFMASMRDLLRNDGTYTNNLPTHATTNNEKKVTDNSQPKNNRLVSAHHRTSARPEKRNGRLYNDLRKKNAKRYAHIKSKVDTNLESVDKNVSFDHSHNNGNVNDRKTRRTHSAVIWRSNTNLPINQSYGDTANATNGFKARSESAHVNLQSAKTKEMRIISPPRSASTNQPQKSLFSPRTSSSNFCTGVSKSTTQNSSKMDEKQFLHNFHETTNRVSSSVPSPRRLPHATTSANSTQNANHVSHHNTNHSPRHNSNHVPRHNTNHSPRHNSNHVPQHYGSALDLTEPQWTLNSPSRTKSASAVSLRELKDDTTYNSMLPSNLAKNNRLSSALELHRNSSESLPSKGAYNPRDSLNLSMYKNLKELETTPTKRKDTNPSIKATDDSLGKKPPFPNSKPPLPSKKHIRMNSSIKDQAHVNGVKGNDVYYRDQSDSWRSNFDYIYNNQINSLSNTKPYRTEPTKHQMLPSQDETWSGKTGSIELDSFLKRGKENKVVANEIIDHYLQEPTTNLPPSSNGFSTKPPAVIKPVERNDAKYQYSMEYDDSSERLLNRYLSASNRTYDHSTTENTRRSYDVASSTTISGVADNIQSLIDGMTLENLRKQASSNTTSSTRKDHSMPIIYSSQNNYNKITSENYINTNSNINGYSYTSKSLKFPSTNNEKKVNASLDWVKHGVMDSISLEKEKRKTYESTSSSSDNEQRSSTDSLPPLGKNFISLSMSTARPILKKEKTVRIAIDQNRYHCYTPEYEKPLRKLSDYQF